MKYENFIRLLPGSGIITDDQGSITYPEIPSLLNEIDTYLNEQGDREEFCIGVQAENSISALITIVYLLSKNINFYLVPARSRSMASLPPFCDKILTVRESTSKNAGLVERLSLTSNPAYVLANRTIGVRTGAIIFSTSGSTGAVKYVYYSSSRLFRNAENAIRRFHIDSHSRLLIPVPVTHMYGMGVGLLPALMTRASLTLTTKNNLIKLFQHIADFNPGLTLINPTLIRMILTLNKKIPGKSTFITAGETLDLQTHRRFETLYGQLVNLYGCTELGAIATSSRPRFLRSASRDRQWLSPLQNVTVMIRGRQTGELFCRHNAGFKGYIDQNGVPTVGRPKGSWHRLRDIGVYAGNKRFKVTGRRDNCINRAGFLISLEEIEQALCQLLPDLSHVIVFELSQPFDPISPLIAVCEMTAGVPFDGAAMRSLCRSRMDRYFVPDEFYPIAEMPKLSSGKPDRLTVKSTYPPVI